MADQSSKQSDLPPDPGGMNNVRASWAQAALDTFRAATGSEDDTLLYDLLCDLMHWADRNPGHGDFEEALDRARMAYREETTAVTS
jgi:hypothetical protein